MSVGRKENSESPTGLEPMSLTAHQSDALTTELRETGDEPGHILGSYMTCVLHTVLGSAMSNSSCVVINIER